MEPWFQDHMLVNPLLQAEVVKRCQNVDFRDEPDAVAHDLGMIDLPDGRSIRAWLCHAADGVVLDDLGQTLLIRRLNNPGRGKLALPGGLLDTKFPGVESSREAALREVMEETGMPAGVLAQAEVTRLGHRRYVRPFDIRQAWNDLPGTPVQMNEIFTVSTMAFRIRLPGNLRNICLIAGDDAAAVIIVPAKNVKVSDLAVPDHIEMIHDALHV